MTTVIDNTQTITVDGKQVETTTTTLSMTGAVGALAGAMNTLAQVGTVQAAQLDYENQVSEEIRKKQETFTDNLPSSNTGLVFGGTSSEYAEMAKEGLQAQNGVSRVASNESMISGQIQNLGSKIEAESSVATRSLIPAYQRYANIKG